MSATVPSGGNIPDPNSPPPPSSAQPENQHVSEINGKTPTDLLYGFFHGKDGPKLPELGLLAIIVTIAAVFFFDNNAGRLQTALGIATAFLKAATVCGTFVAIITIYPWIQKKICVAPLVDKKGNPKFPIYRIFKLCLVVFASASLILISNRYIKPAIDETMPLPLAIKKKKIEDAQKIADQALAVSQMYSADKEPVWADARAAAAEKLYSIQLDEADRAKEKAFEIADRKFGKGTPQYLNEQRYIEMTYKMRKAYFEKQKAERLKVK